MMVNNEIGTVEPVKGIGMLSHMYEIPFHVDATQAIGHLHVDIKDIGCDFLSASAHKIHGLKGTGILYWSQDTTPYMDKLMYGGHQEYGLRPGTENIPGIVSMGAAIEETNNNITTNIAYVCNLRDYMWEELLKIPGSHMNGVDIALSYGWRSNNNISVRFDGISGQRLQELLAEKNICVSTGSACQSGDNTPSYVLKAIGLSDEAAMSTIRITLDENNDIDQINYALKWIKFYVDFLRNMSKE